MKTNQLNQVLHHGGKGISPLRLVTALLLLLALGIGNAWGSSYYTAFTATSSSTAKGLVYASGPGTSTAPANDEAYGASSGIGQSGDTGGSSKTNSYYAWAKAARGYAFNGWTISGSNGGVSPTSSSTQNGVEVKVTSNKTDGTNTGTATANWTDATSVTVTFGVPVDGSYTMTYSYTVVKDGKFATEEKAYSMTESSTAASGQIKSYAGDNVTVSTDATNFEGWYNNASFSGTALSTASSYSFTVSGATSIYAKFKSATKYYGKVAASIPAVPNSMPGGGMIYISNIAGTTGAIFSENAQEAKITTFNSDATPPASMNQTFYLHARPNDRRYAFRGWFDNEAGTGTALSTNEDWEYTFAVSSHTEASPTTKTVYAIFDFKLYYMQVEIEPAIQGQGMVLASETKLTNPEYGLFSSESSVLTYALRAGASGTNDVYVYAKPKYGYKLAGWYSDPECTIAASVASDGKYTATGSSIYPMDPTIIKLYAKFVEESKIKVTYNNPDHEKGEYKAYALDIAEVNDEYVWSQTEIFSSEGKLANTVQSQYKTDVLILSAEAISGYGVTSWTDGSTTKTTPSQIYNTTATAAKTVGVTFGDAKPFLVKASGVYYSNFSDALTAVGSSGQITVVQNAYIPAGNYTIPNGVTLLVPFDDAYTLRTTDPTHAYAAPGTPSVYVKLTLGANAHLTVGGAISVSSTSQGNQPYGGCVYDKYGQIDMESGSTITLNSGANLYCWGYITGAGEITAKSGSKVYEDFQIACWRGGSAASSINGNSKKVFPLAQYYIQNIEAKLHVESGATEYVWTAVSANSKAQRPSGPITLISKSSGLFQVSSGSLTKWFDAVNDRQMYEIAGNTALGSVSMTVYIVTINSTEYVLPLTNNMDITIKSGTLSCSNDVAILPGASIRIDEGAKASITGDIFVYDKAEWPADGASAFNYNNVSFKKVNYTATPITNARTYAKMKDAILDVNGTFETNGKFYTTAGGADICSSKGTGIVKFTGTSGSASATYQATQSGTSISYTTIPVTAARLHNSDDSYTLTVGSVSGDKYIYNKNSGIWMKNPKTITWNANGGLGELTTTAYSEGSFLGELPAAAKDGYDLAGWYTTADGGTKISATTKVTATTTYYAHWTPKTYTITYKNQGESTFAGSTHIDTPNPHPTTHTYGKATTLNDATKSGYTFGGWYKTVSCTGTQVSSLGTTEVTKDITLYAKWTEIPSAHTLTWNFNGGTPSGSYTEAGLVATGATITYPTLSKTGYTLTWSTNVSSMPDDNLTITANWTLISYTVRFNANEGTGTMSNQSFQYGESKKLTSNAFTRTGYTFAGWATSASGAVVHTDGKTVSNLSSTNGATVDLYAKWTANSYMVRFNANEGTGTMSNQSFNYGESKALTTNAFTRTGYTFAGWATSASGEVVHTDGKTVSNLSSTNGATVDLYAKWTANTNTAYTVKHFKQALDGSYAATPDETDDLTGTTGASVTPAVKSYEGFDAPVAQTVTILADGSRVVEYKYTRKSYDLSWVTDGNALTGSYTHGSTKYGATITAPNTPTKAGCVFAGWHDGTSVVTPAATMPAAATTYTATFVATNIITWKVEGQPDVTQEVALDATPVYPNGTPSKASTDELTFTFDGWSDGTTSYGKDETLPSVKGPATYTAQFTSGTRFYTITWLNKGGGVLTTTKGEWHADPAYPIVDMGGTPTYTDELYLYKFAGWSPEIVQIEGDATYEAQYDRINNLVVSDDQTITINATVTTTTVKVDGKLNVSGGKTLSTDDLILEATPAKSGEIFGAVNATEHAYFDFSQPGGFKAKTWYAVAVPWRVDASWNNGYTQTCGISAKKGSGEYVPLALGRQVDLIYYDGYERAEHGHSDACWQYVELVGQNEEMQPGKAYMFLLLEAADVVRFERKEGTELHTNSTEVFEYEEKTNNDGKDANWNGIANPATYMAYLNAGPLAGYKYNGNDRTYTMVDMNKEEGKLPVGQSVYIQVSEAKTIVANATSFAAAPRRIRSTEQPVRYDVYVSGDENFSDRIIVRGDVEKEEDKYTIGEDLVKFEVSSHVPQMWVERYNSQLGVNTALLSGNTALFPLGISVPQTGEYTISVNDKMANEQMENDYMLYLTIDGRSVWNITYAPYTTTLEKGTTNRYGLKLVRNSNAPAVTTDIQDVQAGTQQAARKVLLDGQVYILRGNEMYSVDGRIVK